MAKYMIEHKCGHEKEANIIGPEKDRPGKREWLTTQSCPDCKREQARLGVEAWTDARGLVALQGSAKQIDWANKIRKGLLEEMDKYVEPESEHEEMPYIIRAYNWTAKQSQTVWWINRKAETGKSLMLQIVALLKTNDAARKAEA